MKSMTGFGKAAHKLKNIDYRIEIRSINSRFIEISYLSHLRKPSIEHKISELLKKHLHRGKIEVVVKVDRAHHKDHGTFNLDEIKKRYHELEKVRKALKLKDAIDLELLAELNRTWFFQEREEVSFDETDLVKVATLAISDLVADRAREGQFLQKVLLKRLAVIEKSVKKIHGRASKASSERFERLKSRVSQLLANSSEKPSARLEFEIAVLADKSDVTEELDRLLAHLAQMKNLFLSHEPVGRQLDFLLQEMNREMNTIGSKSADTAMTNEVIHVKTELEKIREQIQNLE